MVTVVNANIVVKSTPFNIELMACDSRSALSSNSVVGVIVAYIFF